MPEGTRAYNSIVALVGTQGVPGRIEALEGGRGVMRVSLDGDAAELSEGSECVLEMHDGARFRVSVTERLEGNELRLKLLGRA